MRHPNSSLFFYDETPRFKLAFPCCPLLQKQDIRKAKIRKSRYIQKRIFSGSEVLIFIGYLFCSANPVESLDAQSAFGALFYITQCSRLQLISILPTLPSREPRRASRVRGSSFYITRCSAFIEGIFFVNASHNNKIRTFCRLAMGSDLLLFFK